MLIKHIRSPLIIILSLADSVFFQVVQLGNLSLLLLMPQELPGVILTAMEHFLPVLKMKGRLCQIWGQLNFSLGFRHLLLAVLSFPPEIIINRL